MLKYKNVPQDTLFVLVSETDNAQEPFVRARGGLYQLMEILAESNTIKFLPVPPDVVKQIETANPSVVCLKIPIVGPIGQRKSEERFFQGTESHSSVRRSLRPLLAGLPEPGEFMR